jgi:Sigma-70 region 2
VFGLALTIVRSTAVAEEVAQEAFLRVWRNAGAYDARRGQVATWVLTITRNLAIDALRLRGRQEQPVDPAAGPLRGRAADQDGRRLALRPLTARPGGVAWGSTIQVPIQQIRKVEFSSPDAPGPRWQPHPGCLGAYDSGYPGGMFAFIRKKFVGSYFALRAVSRVHCWPVYAWRTRSLASSLVKFT